MDVRHWVVFLSASVTPFFACVPSQKQEAAETKGLFEKKEYVVKTALWNWEQEKRKSEAQGEIEALKQEEATSGVPPKNLEARIQFYQEKIEKAGQVDTHSRHKTLKDAQQAVDAFNKQRMHYDAWIETETREGSGLLKRIKGGANAEGLYGLAAEDSKNLLICSQGSLGQCVKDLDESTGKAPLTVINIDDL